jgi:hypothetical protein
MYIYIYIHIHIYIYVPGHHMLNFVCVCVVLKRAPLPGQAAFNHSELNHALLTPGHTNTQLLTPPSYQNSVAKCVVVAVGLHKQYDLGGQRIWGSWLINTTLLIAVYECMSRTEVLAQVKQKESVSCFRHDFYLETYWLRLLLRPTLILPS